MTDLTKLSLDHLAAMNDPIDSRFRQMALGAFNELRRRYEEQQKLIEELRNLLEDVVNELDLSEGMIEEHGPLGTAPAKLVALVLARKNTEIAMLNKGFVNATLAKEKKDE